MSGSGLNWNAGCRERLSSNCREMATLTAMPFRSVAPTWCYARPHIKIRPGPNGVASAKLDGAYRRFCSPTVE
jgi:hypothetical protein